MGKNRYGGTPGVVYDDKMRYVGEATVAVAAENVDIAEEAANLIKVDYEVLPAIVYQNQCSNVRSGSLEV